MVWSDTDRVNAINATEQMSNGNVRPFSHQIVNIILPGSVDRAEKMFDSPYDFGNWITAGTLDTFKGTIQPEEPLSFQHWKDSFDAVVITYTGGKIVKSGAAAIKNAGTKVIKTGKANSTRVGQWMSETEYKEFVKTSEIPRTNVLTKGKEGYMRQANKGDYYVEFDVDSSLLKTKDEQLGWSLVKSKNQMYLKLAEKKGEILPAPIGANIEHIFTKPK